MKCFSPLLNSSNGTESRIAFVMKAFQMYKLLILETIHWLQNVKEESDMG